MRALPAVLASLLLLSPVPGPAMAELPGGAPGDLSGLPLVEVPARAPGSGTLAVMLTGDGDWAAIDKEIAADLSQHGVAVVGLNMRAYLTHRRTPEETAGDVARIARHYMDAWQRSRVVLVGYSRGADIAPFVANRLPADLRQRLSLVALLGPSTYANFEFHWADLLSNVTRPDDLPTLPELARLKGTRVVCVYGTGEKDSLCRAADPQQVTLVPRGGQHHFDGDFRALGDIILGALAG
jgi:type IV secretory pathway VirJ component